MGEPGEHQTIAALRDFDALGGRASPAAGHLRYVLLDVFTRTPLAGNPLAVFTDARQLPAARMQDLARELNLSEAVFLLAARGGGDVAARIFTPAAELPFAGHPVLGAAVLAGAALGREHVVVETAGGEVAVELGAHDGRARFARMRQPLPSSEPFEGAPQLLAALALERSQPPVAAYRNGPLHVLVTLADEGAVQALVPDGAALSALGEVCVSCFCADGARVRTRMFAPALGVAEDPATGSAAGPLAVHLARHGLISFGQEIEISQGREIGRPSQLFARVLGSPERLERVEVGGWSVIVGDAQLRP